MKRLGGLWEQLTSWDNLLLAYRKARRGKRDRIEVARFACGLEQELLGLRRELRAGSYRPSGYRQFTLYDRKPRVISAVPFRHWVVHHALMNVIEPPLDRRFIDDCYACRKGKGVHAAVNRYQTYARRYAYVLKLDIRQYFPSIDHAILKDTLRRRIKDGRVLHLLDQIVDGSPESDTPLVYFPDDDSFTPLERRCGIPIGNLTSQFFANLHLDGFDHWIKETLRVPGHLRYVDDLLLLNDSKKRLWDYCKDIEIHLAALRLRLHERKRQIYRTTEWVDVLGYKVGRHRRRLRNNNGYRFRRKLWRLAEGYASRRFDWATVNASVQSWIGHARHADTIGLRKSIFGGVKFTRARA